MKNSRTIIISLVLVLIVICFSACTNKMKDDSIGNEYISIDSAKEIAINHAELSLDDVEFKVEELDTNDYFVHYDIEFIYENYEYDYEIDALSGNILEYDKDYEKESKNDKTDISNYIGEDSAKSIVLEHANLEENEISGYKSELDIDDLIPHYEIEFYSGKYEYEYDVNAKTGKIISSEKEID